MVKVSDNDIHELVNVVAKYEQFKNEWDPADHQATIYICPIDGTNKNEAFLMMT
jgi:hypothetical protein